jgi:uncharacterized Zn-finger protein
MHALVELFPQIPPLGFLAEPNSGLLSCNMTLDSPHPSAELDPCSFQSGVHAPLEYDQPSATYTPDPFEQEVVGGQSSFSSVPQKGTDIEQELSTRIEDGGSVRVAPRILRVLRPRSSKPRDELQRIAPDLVVNREQLSSSCLVSVNSPGAVSANYRQLSIREVKEMRLGQHRRYYKCLMDGCDRVFSRKSNVENHIRTHLDDKPFVCSLGTW